MEKGPTPSISERTCGWFTGSVCEGGGVGTVRVRVLKARCLDKASKGDGIDVDPAVKDIGAVPFQTLGLGNIATLSLTSGVLSVPCWVTSFGGWRSVLGVGRGVSNKFPLIFFSGASRASIS